MPIRVANIWKHLRSPGETRVYIGRACRGYAQSPLANPWKIGQDRDETLGRYRDWLRETLKDTTSPQAQEILRLGHLVSAGEDLVLLCWCSPSACHGDLVAEVVQKVASRLGGSNPPRPA
jgi:hypothetical protein